MTWGSDPISQLQKQRLIEAQQRLAQGQDPARVLADADETPTEDGPVGLLIEAIEQLTGKTVRLVPREEDA